MNKKELISRINQFFLDNNKQGEAIYLTEVGRNFETSTGTEEGAIEIIAIRQDEFIYFPAGHSDEELDGELTVLSENDLTEIISGLEEWEADQEKTFKRADL